jgi:TonB-linked SusC/RagA family outer membrane protein
MGKTLQKNYWYKCIMIFIAVMFIGSAAWAQQSVKITGKVTALSDNASLPGVTVMVKGTSQGTVTDVAGNFSINGNANTVLVFTFTGFAPKEIVVGDRSTVNVQLAEDAQQLKEVVVTALGIEKKSSQLTYSTQEVSGKEVLKVPQTNFMNSLSGKVAGANIYKNSSGVGGSVKVLLRGNKSAQGNNQPLYVIDGVPMVNQINQSINQSMSSNDGGDGISNLNPDDIESINVLKGASAAALYGSQAANGVILITTKKGKAGAAKIDFSTSYQSDNIMYKPELQKKYGQTAVGSEESWGPALSSPNTQDNIDKFLKSGNTFVNSISLASGNEKMQTYVSYANTYANSPVPNNDMTRHNIDIRQTSNFFNNKLVVDGNITLVNQTINNPVRSGFQNNVLYGLYGFPVGLDFNQFEQYTKFDPVRNTDIQNWHVLTTSNQNPYWMTNKILFANKRNRILANLSLKYNITDWLNFQVRGNVDRTSDVNTQKYYLGTAVGYSGVNGGYGILNQTLTQYYSDALLSLNKTIGKFAVSGVLGTSITDGSVTGQNASSIYLYVPNFFTIQNMDPSNGNPVSSLSENHSQLQAVFGSVDLTYNNWISATVTGRNDWSSNLSYTPNGSYFYPSFGLSLLLHQALKLPEAITFAKVRASYAIVGNTVPTYVTNPQNSINGRGDVVFNNTAPFTDLNPEKTKSAEYGAELHFFKDQLSVNVTYYKTNTINQFFSIAVPPGTGYSSRFINGGNIQNSGIEATLGYRNLPGSALGWNSVLNFSANRNVIKELATSVSQFIISNDVNNYYSILKVGGAYGDIYGQVLKRDDQGRVIVASDGTPTIQTGAPSLLGNSNPRFQLGWNNNFSYKNFSLSFLVDGSFGGKIMSLTNQILDGLGVSKASGDARDNGGVSINGVTATGTPVTKVDASKYYHTVGGIQHVTGEYMYDATTVRIREVSIGYNLPKSVLGTGFVKNARLSLTGRNLAFLYKKAPVDPESIFSTGNGYSGIEVLSLPSTRGLGFNINVTF